MRVIIVSKSFLLVSERSDTHWPLVLRQALTPLGKLHIVSEEKALQIVAQSYYDAIIVDAGAVTDAIAIVSRLRAQQSKARIIVATASPTWTRAREALHAGAVDYVRKSLDEKELRSAIEAVLELPLPPAQH